MILSVIIVSYNTKELTLQTIDSVIKTTNNSKLLKNKVEIIVVDNNSKDGSVTAIKKLTFKNLKVIANKTNLGFAAANNDGLEKSSGKYIIFLNSDTIVQDQALETMANRFIEDEKDTDTEKLGVLSPTLLNKDLTLQPQGGSFPTLPSLFFHMSMMDDLPLIGKFLPSTQHTGKSTRLSLDDLEKRIELIQTDWVGGTAMMIPRSALDEFGSLDPNIFMYGEDVEICMRAANHHYEVMIDPSAQIIHLQNQSSTSANAIRGEYKGYDFIYAKHFGAGKRQVARVVLQLGAFMRIFVFSTISPNKEKVGIYRTVLSDLNNPKE